MFDNSFADTLSPGKAIACRWVAHDPSNEGLTFYKLNHAKNYDDYLEAIRTFACPGQNFVFAAKSGDIAIWQQAKFPARWDGQGVTVMPGQDSSYMWQGFIPQSENPHAINPAQGFLVSANQRPADSAYPYFIPGNYINARAISINHQLQNMQQVTVDDMKKLQNSYFNATAEDARPLLLKYVRENDLTADAKKYLSLVRRWDLQATPASVGQTVYQLWWDSLAVEVWKDELIKVQPAVIIPNQQTLLEALLRDSAFKYVDNINTPQKETLNDVVTIALAKASVELAKEDKAGTLEWTKHKSPRIYHLLRKNLLPFSEPIAAGGNGDIINATTTTHGPSWRMIVQLSETTEAYGVYPGGQSGNPGSQFYDNFIDSWVKGEYHVLWMMKRGETGDKRVKWLVSFGNK
jgi:penicillin amidase